MAVAVAWGSPEPATAAARADRPVGVFSPFGGEGPVFARLGRLSLRPGRPRLRLGEYHEDWSFSPDRSRLALGMGGASPTCGRGICIVDVETMRIAGYVPASVAVEAVAWLRPRRIVGVLQRDGVIVVDPAAGTVVRSRDLPYNVYAPPVARTSEGLAVLIDANPPRLIRVNADGDVGSLALTRIGRGAGLAAAGRGARVFVVSAEGPAAEVDVRTMDVRYHRVASRPRTGSTEALWLGRGLLGAVSERGGVQVIDTSSWSARTISLRATRARLAAGRLLLWSDGELGPRRAGVGLRVHTRDGRRLVRHLFGERKLAVEVAGPNAFVLPPWSRRSRATQVVRVRTGGVVGSAASPPRGYDAQILSAPLGSGGRPR